MPYHLNPDGTAKDKATAKAALTKRLAEARRSAREQPATDSPVYQLVENYPDVDHTKTDMFRDRVQYSLEQKTMLTAARKVGVDALRALERRFAPIEDLETGVAVDLFLSYRATKAWQDMIDLASKMSRPLAATVMVQEQLALALNRAGRGDEAEKVLKELLHRRGPSSETLGILGRVYKDRWESALKADDRHAAAGYLDQAIDAYLRGFEADWRDAYPGVNAVTLMALKEPPDPRRVLLIPVVAYAVERRIATGTPDYWDYATRLELAVLGKDEQAATTALRHALAIVRESWEPETTARNLRLIREARMRRGEAVSWANEIEQALERRAKP
jgi:tetratricopeptide (TPR) repeat protein